jgi:hypothetical protein
LYLWKFFSAAIKIELIKRTTNTLPTTIENMGVNHRCANIFMPEQFLNGADVIAVLEQMRGKTMAKSMTTAERVKQQEVAVDAWQAQFHLRKASQFAKPSDTETTVRYVPHFVLTPPHSYLLPNGEGKTEFQVLPHL